MANEYLHHCEDCIELPSEFPASCAEMLIDQAAEFFNTGTVQDPKCLAHCGLTMLCWSSGRWINSEDDHPAPMFQSPQPPKNVDVSRMRQELMKCCPDKKDPTGEEKTPPAMDQETARAAEDSGGDQTTEEAPEPAQGDSWQTRKEMVPTSAPTQAQIDSVDWNVVIETILYLLRRFLR